MTRWLRRAWVRATTLSQRLVVYLIVQTSLLAVGVCLVVLVNGNVSLAIGTSLLAGAAAGYALFAYVLLTDGWSRRIEALLDLGLRQVWLHRSVRMKAEYDHRLDAAHEAIDLLGFGQRSFREDQAQNFRVWLARGVTVRLLLLDPEYPSKEAAFAAQRDREEGGGSIANDVAAFLQELKRQQLHEDDKFCVRLFRCLPTLNVFRIDDELFWGPYLLRQQSRNSPTLLVARGGPLFDAILGHFDAIWDGDAFSAEVNWEDVVGT